MPHTPKVILPKDKQEPSHKRLGMRLEKRVFYPIFRIFDGMGKFALATDGILRHVALRSLSLTHTAPKRYPFGRLT